MNLLAANVERYFAHSGTLYIAATLLLLTGCSSKPPRLVAPKLKPAQIVQRALESFDGNGDGMLSASELDGAPGIHSNLPSYDTDGDGKVSEVELEERIKFMARLNFALTAARAHVRLNGKPLEGAIIEMTPELHFEGQIKPASGVTDHRGLAMMAIADEDLPKAQRGLKGVHTGSYRVRITHPDKSLPAKYNTSTTLGYETKIGAPDVDFELKQ